MVPWVISTHHFWNISQVIKEYVPVILHQQRKFLPIAEKQKQPIPLKWLHINYKLDKVVCAKHMHCCCHLCSLSTWAGEFCGVDMESLTMNWVYGSQLCTWVLFLFFCTVTMLQCVEHVKGFWSITQVRQVLLYNGTKMKMVEVLCSSNISNSFIG